MKRLLKRKIPADSGSTKPGTGNSREEDRPMAAAGRFYPSNPKVLYSQLETLFSHAHPKNAGSVIAVISPHAGYEFSGIVAASSFNQVDPSIEYENIFIIGSSHYAFFEGASVCHQGNYVTPLGKVKVNADLADKLVKENSLFCFNPEADKYEHSLEVQIPFLQFCLRKNFNVLPLVLGTQSAFICKNIAAGLKPYFNRKNLFVFSTDFSHFPSYVDAKRVDKKTCDAILSNSAETLLKVMEENAKSNVVNLDTSLCGWTSILTMLYLTGDIPEIRLMPVLYRNSGDSIYADKSRVVGYWSIVAENSPE
jgi:AmmeMemoRadiSam system protein B